MRSNLKFGFTSALVLGGAMLISMASSFIQRSSPVAVGSLLTVPGETPQATESLDPDWHDVRRILAARCASCHRGGTDLPDLTSYEAIIAAKTEVGEPLIVSGQVQESSLWEMANWNHAGQHHPNYAEGPQDPGENPHHWLAGNELAAIERWIRNGARQRRMPSD